MIGASKRIGAEAAKKFFEEGADVAAFYSHGPRRGRGGPFGCGDRSENLDDRF